MSLFTEICLIVLPSVVVWHLFGIFVADESKYQKFRFRKALETIYKLPTTELDIIYKDRQFNVSVQYKEITAVYSYYEIWINGSLAATYHRMKHSFISSYCFKEENKRHADEVRSIVYAAAMVLKKAAKPKKLKRDGYSEYSYFK